MTRRSIRGCRICSIRRRRRGRSRWPASRVDEMKALITASGGELLSLDEHVTEWHSFTYHVRRLPVPAG